MTVKPMAVLAFRVFALLGALATPVVASAAAPGTPTAGAGLAVYGALRGAGMEIPFPQHEVRLRKGGGAALA